MVSLRPVSLYGLTVPPGDEPVLAFENIPATIRITMAAIDPFAKPLPTQDQGSEQSMKGATLRLIRVPVPDFEDDDDEDADEDDDEDDDLAALLDGDMSDEDEEEDEDEDEAEAAEASSSKKSKAEKTALLKELANGTAAVANGSAKITGNNVNGLEEDEEEDEDEDEESEYDDEMNGEAEVYVLCSLDASKSYQQTLDITINPHETVMFSVTGTHTVYLTGNFVIDDDEPLNFESDSEDDYDLSPDPEELGMDMMDEDDDEDEEDELDDLEDPTGAGRITELSDQDEADDDEMPDLIAHKPAPKPKGKNKRPAEEEDEDSDEDEEGTKQSLDELINKSLKAQTLTTAQSSKPATDIANAQGHPVGPDGKPLSKSQLKKLKKKQKNNEGVAVAPSTATGVQEDIGTKAEPSLGTKKVQFAENLVTGPTNKATTNGDAKKAPAAGKEQSDGTKKASLGVKTIQGVTIDDRKLGSGPVAKSGDKVGMRYIGKLQKDKRIFDSNKKGKPFQFTLGKGEVIKGWDIGIAGMSAGGERRLTIPANLAYGSKGAGKDIPPNSVLEFDVKLLEITK